MRDLKAFDREFSKALEHCGKGQVIVLNGAGEPGQRAINEVGPVIETGRGPRWSTSGGDCFFASTDIMLGLMIRHTALPFRLVTGRFEHPDKPHPIFHAWLETRDGMGGRIVVNVSNLQERPLYTIRRPDYFALNNCTEVLQLVGAPAFRKRAFAVLRSQGLPARESELEHIEVRSFAQSLLRKTLAISAKARGTAPTRPAQEPGF
jgi:hypothetical protein